MNGHGNNTGVWDAYWETNEAFDDGAFAVGEKNKAWSDYNY